jgi:hypothetical protein
MVFAARDDPTNQFVRPADIPELPLGALTAPAVRSLLEERVGTRLPDHVLGELADRTGGNPLAVIEAPAQLNRGQLTGADVLPHDLLLSARMERTFLDRCRRLSAPAQTLLLLAAADDDSLRFAELRSAGDSLGVLGAAYAEVETSGCFSTIVAEHRGRTGRSAAPEVPEPASRGHEPGGRRGLGRRDQHTADCAG